MHGQNPDRFPCLRPKQSKILKRFLKKICILTGADLGRGGGVT